MKNIKLSISGQPNNLNIQQFVGNDENIFENYKFHINSSFENPDYLFVLARHIALVQKIEEVLWQKG